MKYVKLQIMQIMSLALDINPPEIEEIGKKGTAVFVRWSPHCNFLDVDIHENGWSPISSSSFRFSVCCSDDDAPEKLDDVIRILEKIKFEELKKSIVEDC